MRRTNKLTNGVSVARRRRANCHELRTDDTGQRHERRVFDKTSSLSAATCLAERGPMQCRHKLQLRLNLLGLFLVGVHDMGSIFP
jgi:hypothetical protein